MILINFSGRDKKVGYAVSSSWNMFSEYLSYTYIYIYIVSWARLAAGPPGREILVPS